MAATPDELFRFLDRLGIAHATVFHPALFTVEQSQALRGKVPGAHSKNLFLRDGSAELMAKTLGVEPGAVTPFGALNDRDRRVTILLDTDLMRHGTVNFHPLRNTMTTSIASAGLIKFLEATRHSPRILPLAGSADSARVGLR